MVTMNKALIALALGHALAKKGEQFAMTARAQLELPVVCHGMRRKGESAVIGVIPNKVATNEPKREEYLRDFEEVPLVLASDYAALTTRLAESEARAEVDARDAARYRVLRSFGKQMKLYIYDDPADAYSGDWIYNPHPELVDELADAAIAQEAEREAGSG